jgi:hypothetical protein
MLTKIKDFYKNTFIGFHIIHPFLEFYRYFSYKKYYSTEKYLKLKYKEIFGKELDLKNPKTFNDKINWLKLNEVKPIQTICADKFKVRDFIAEKIGSEYLIPLFFSTKYPSEIIPENLPDEPFIIKVNHDSSGGIIVKNKNDIKDWKKIQSSLRWKMNDNFYWNCREPQYKNIKPHIIVEKLLLDEKGNIPADFKLHFFNGKLGIIQIDSDRLSYHKRNLYDPDWNHLDFIWEYEQGIITSKPAMLDSMKMLGEKIAKDFIYVRVDFYLIFDKIYFGEITFHPGGGYDIFKPEKFDLEVGKLLELPIE